MAKKISELTIASKPLSGGEVIPMNQNGSTVTASLSDVQSYTLGGLSLSIFPTLSGNNTFIGDSNTFTKGLSTNDIKFTNPEIIKIGTSAGMNSGLYGTAIDVIAIGDNSGNLCGSAGNSTDVIFIGNKAGYISGYYGFSDNVISIGNNSGNGAGFSGYCSNVISIGNKSGYGIGYLGNVSNSIFIGLSSGYQQSSSNNTFVGDLTNTTTPSNSSLSGCIAIGYGAQPSAKNTIAIGSSSVPLSVVPGVLLTNSLSGLRIMINGIYYTIPLLA